MKTTAPHSSIVNSVNVDLLIPTRINKSEGEVRGSVVLTSQIESMVDEINIKLVEAYILNNGGFSHEEELHMGEVHLVPHIQMHAGETRAFPFRLTFEILHPQNNPKPIVGIALSFEEGEKEEPHFFIEANVDLKGTGTDPSVKKDIRIE